MSNVLERLNAIREDPYAIAREKKAEGMKIVGITPMYFPEELVHAANALPVILQESNQLITLGLGHIYHYFCGFNRSNVDLAVKKEVLEGLFDAMIVSDLCLQTRKGADTMRRHMPTTPFIYVQRPLEATRVTLTAKRLEKCRRELEAVLGEKITDQALEKSIAIFNRNRDLLGKIDQIRNEKPGIVSMNEMVSLTMASMVMPKEEHCRLVEEFMGELQTRKQVPEDNQVKLFLSGHLCQAVKPDILGLIENLNGVVVGDDLYTGYRYFAGHVESGLPPMEALARHYLNPGLPCTTTANVEQNLAQYLAAQVGKRGAEGVILLVVMFCEAFLVQKPLISHILQEAGIPVLYLETEHEVVSLESMQTRIQAFLETLKSKA